MYEVVAVMTRLRVFVIDRYYNTMEYACAPDFMKEDTTQFRCRSACIL